MADSNAKKLAQLLDGNGDVLLTNLDNISVTPAGVSDQDNTSTGLFTLPAGTTAQRPVTSYTGAQRYNTDLGVMEYYNGTQWLKIAAEQTTLDSVSGNIYAGVAGSDLTLTGSGFLTDSITVNFTQSSDAIDEDVVVTASSDTSATVTVPANVYNNVTAGNVVSIIVTNADSTTSDAVTKTAIGLPTGGTVTTSGDYRYHTFTSSGTFTNTISNLKGDYLIVAGGGGGGFDGGGGGGAGGLRQSTFTSLTTGGKTITVGSGGAGAGAYSVTPGDGGDSSALGVTSTGGGGAARVESGSYSLTAGRSGGSGGGGMANNSTAIGGGSGTAGQGNDGGDGVYPASWDGAGGGGAGSAGGNNGSNSGGAGGAGLQYSTWGTATSTGDSGYYAGGGGGASEGSSSPGAGGSGGGGIGGSQPAGQTGENGNTNTGGGGGGGDNPGGSGGSGIVIVRYDTTDLTS
jgi:hypothetical protein